MLPLRGLVHTRRVVGLDRLASVGAVGRDDVAIEGPVVGHGFSPVVTRAGSAPCHGRAGRLPVTTLFNPGTAAATSSLCHRSGLLVAFALFTSVTAGPATYDPGGRRRFDRWRHCSSGGPHATQP